MCKCKVNYGKGFSKIEIELAVIIVLLLFIVCDLYELEELCEPKGCSCGKTCQDLHDCKDNKGTSDSVEVEVIEAE